MSRSTGMSSRPGKRRIFRVSKWCHGTWHWQTCRARPAAGFSSPGLAAMKFSLSGSYRLADASSVAPFESCSGVMRESAGVGRFRKARGLPAPPRNLSAPAGEASDRWPRSRRRLLKKPRTDRTTCGSVHADRVCEDCRLRETAGQHPAAKVRSLRQLEMLAVPCGSLQLARARTGRSRPCALGLEVRYPFFCTALSSNIVLQVPALAQGTKRARQVVSSEAMKGCCRSNPPARDDKAEFSVVYRSLCRRISVAKIVADRRMGCSRSDLSRMAKITVRRHATERCEPLSTFRTTRLWTLFGCVAAHARSARYLDECAGSSLQRPSWPQRNLWAMRRRTAGNWLC